MNWFRHIVFAVLLTLLLCSCGGRPRIIPRSTMTDIYAEMLLADQWLADHPSHRKDLDTLLFYDPIFRRYGYTFEDYDASVQHYLKDPEKFSRVFRDATAMLRKRSAHYQKKADELQRIKDFNAGIKGFTLKRFDRDTFLWRTPHKDSLIRAAFIRDSVIRDSIIRDSIIRDSLVRDSILRDSLRLDSLRLHRGKKSFHTKKARQLPQVKDVETITN
ncbi:MAG: DUF4296 domain-containing protein [Bacteroidales bacterium]|nr:DUF4296 domain-containing protein [Bacteroidales bacterium]